MKNNIIYALLVGMAFSACSKIDDYREQYQGTKEISYPGVLDSVKVFSGNKRAMVYGLFTSDPKIVKYQVFWNGKQNMVEKTVVRTTGVDTVRLIIDNLAEGGINFEVRTFDNKGNISVPVNVAGAIYGDNYATGIINRAFNPTTTLYNATSKILTIDWLSVDPTAIFTTVEYMATTGEKKKIKVTEPDATLTRITDYKTGTDLVYNTAYLPQKKAIDTFYVAKKDIFKR
ncbi:protein of unknown function [Pedobacter steynii]|uniref:DUF4998 domain-containing protein n=1 Tax=Pedobacter steynii TaxID=430522 RepID=A0A1H0L5G8_9SPHI|nr:DUF4998 domain-containing protein [Pedobacter steynii]NQX43424.1 hypothetical protein [Pedobacter steynii]SDO63457.1 protein of unknown function [Pedobacter steynii]